MTMCIIVYDRLSVQNKTPCKDAYPPSYTYSEQQSGCYCEFIIVESIFNLSGAQWAKGQFRDVLRKKRKQILTSIITGLKLVHTILITDNNS